LEEIDELVVQSLAKISNHNRVLKECGINKAPFPIIDEHTVRRVLMAQSLFQQEWERMCNLRKAPNE